MPAVDLAYYYHPSASSGLHGKCVSHVYNNHIYMHPRPIPDVVVDPAGDVDRVWLKGPVGVVSQLDVVGKAITGA